MNRIVGGYLMMIMSSLILALSKLKIINTMMLIVASNLYGTSSSEAK